MDPKPSLLLVDDEERILRSLAMLFRGQYQVHTALDPQQSLSIIEQHRIHVVVSDQRMPKMRGADLLREIRNRSPNTMRILLTGYSEMDAIVDSVNEGEIFRYVNKPWNSAELREVVAQAARISLTLFAAPPIRASAAERVPEVPHRVAAPVPVPEATTVAPVAALEPEGILVIDDDPEIFRAVREVAGNRHNVYLARSLEQAFGHLEHHVTGVIVSELSVGRESATAALKLLKAQHPEVVTIVMTPFVDTTILINLINQGQIYRLLPRQVRGGPLAMNIASAVRHHRMLKGSSVQRQRHVVEKLQQPEELSVATRVMGLLGRLRNRVMASNG